jgi:hypothetical protein
MAAIGLDDGEDEEKKAIEKWKKKLAKMEDGTVIGEGISNAGDSKFYTGKILGIIISI